MEVHADPVSLTGPQPGEAVWGKGGGVRQKETWAPHQPQMTLKDLPDALIVSKMKYPG